MSLSIYLEAKKGEPFRVSFRDVEYTLPNLNSVGWDTILRFHKMVKDDTFDLLTEDKLVGGHGLPAQVLRKLTRTQLDAMISGWMGYLGLDLREVIVMIDVITEHDREFSYDCRKLGHMNGIQEFLTLPLVDACDFFIMLVSSEPASWVFTKYNNYMFPITIDTIISADTVVAQSGDKNYRRLRKASDNTSIEKVLR